jgi:hypothetical protein
VRYQRSSTLLLTASSSNPVSQSSLPPRTLRQPQGRHILCAPQGFLLFFIGGRVEPGVALELRGGALEPSGVYVEQVVGRKGLPVVEQGLPGARGVDQVKLERVLLVLVVSVSIANAENARVVRQSTSAQAAACCSSFQVWSIVELGRAKLYRPVLHHDRYMMMMMMSALWTRSSVGLVCRAYLVEARGCAAFGRGPRR